jgi:hypothetical protein
MSPKDFCESLGFSGGELISFVEARDEQLAADKSALRAEVERLRIGLADGAEEEDQLRARLDIVEALLRNAVKYAKEDRAVTPGSTRLARLLLKASRYLAQPAGQAGATAAPHPTGIADAVACFDCGGPTAPAGKGLYRCLTKACNDCDALDCDQKLIIDAFPCDECGATLRKDRMPLPTKVAAESGGQVTQGGVEEGAVGNEVGSRRGAQTTGPVPPVTTPASPPPTAPNATPGNDLAPVGVVLERHEARLKRLEAWAEERWHHPRPFTTAPAPEPPKPEAKCGACEGLGGFDSCGRPGLLGIACGICGGSGKAKGTL